MEEENKKSLKASSDLANKLLERIRKTNSQADNLLEELGESNHKDKPIDLDEQKAYSRYVQGQLVKFYKNLNEEEPERFKAITKPRVWEKLEFVREMEEQKDLGMKVKDIVAYWITVAPPECVKLDALVKKVDKMVNRKIVKMALYVYEQRGDSQETRGQGAHVHMLIWPDIKNQRHKPAAFKAAVNNTFKTVVYNSVDKTTSPYALKIIPVSEKSIEPRIKYIHGNKSDESKQKTIEQDIEWRKEKGFDDYYEV